MTSTLAHAHASRLVRVYRLKRQPRRLNPLRQLQRFLRRRRAR